MTQELIERLRARRKRELTLSLAGVVWEPLVNPDGPEAASALQSQSARIAELLEALNDIAWDASFQSTGAKSFEYIIETARNVLTKDSTSG